MTQIGTIEIIKRTDVARGFELRHRRWVVERTFAWLGRYRELAKDFEATPECAVAWMFIAHTRHCSSKTPLSWPTGRKMSGVAAPNSARSFPASLDGDVRLRAPSGAPDMSKS